MALVNQVDLLEVLDFLDSIDGAGYGGMASFEIARQHVRHAVSQIDHQIDTISTLTKQVLAIQEGCTEYPLCYFPDCTCDVPPE